jgi:RND family efflux transporter MFP subunit
MLLVAVVIIGGLAVAWTTHSERLFRTEVKTALAELRVPGTTDAVLAAQGYLKSRQQAAIGPEVAGRVAKMYVQEGQEVEEGQVLAELEHADLDVALDVMRADIERTKAELRETETMLAQDDRDFARAEQLYNSRPAGISRADYERTQSKLEATRSRRDVQGAQVKSAEARLRETERRRDKTFVRAPFAGTVINKEAEVGETIMPGGMGAASGRGAVVTLADLEHLEVETDVKEDYVGRIRRDQPATISVDAVQDRRYSGSVRTIIPMGDRARGTIKVKVAITDADGRLYPETAATVYFLNEAQQESSTAPPQVYAPAEAVQKDDDGHYVWQVVEERVRRVSVELGETRGGRIQIQRGLKGSEQLVLNPPDSLKEDQLVKVGR